MVVKCVLIRSPCFFFLRGEIAINCIMILCVLILFQFLSLIFPKKSILHKGAFLISWSGQYGRVLGFRFRFLLQVAILNPSKSKVLEAKFCIFANCPCFSPLFDSGRTGGPSFCGQHSTLTPPLPGLSARW